MHNSKRLFLRLCVCIIVSITLVANATVENEHSFWKTYITKCVGSESSLTFTQREAQAVSLELNYLGSEYIRFSFVENSILTTGIENGMLTLSEWDELDKSKLTDIFLEFVGNWTDDEFTAFIDDAAILAEFDDGYSLIHMKSIFGDGWVLGKDDMVVEENLSDSDLLDILSKHT